MAKSKGSLSPEELEQLLAAIEEMKARGMKIPQVSRVRPTRTSWNLDENGYFIKNDGKKFKERPELRAFIFSEARFSALISGRGGGKTTSGAQKALYKIMSGQSGAVVNPDMENFKYSTWPEFKEWIPWEMVVPAHRYRKSDSWEPRQPFTLAFLNGAKVFCKGLKDPDSGRGPNINWLWYDEAGRDKTGMGWRLAVAGVRIGPKPQAWITTTPKGTGHWIYKFFVKKEIPDDALQAIEKLGGVYGKEIPLIDIYFTTTEANRENLDPIFYASMLANYPSGWLRDQELYGQFKDEGGTLGDASWFLGKIVSSPPTEHVQGRVRYWDLAASERKIARRNLDDPDSTVGTKVSLADGKFYIEHQVAAQVLWHDIKRLIVDTAMTDGKDVIIYVEQEPGAGGKNQVAELMSIPELSGYTIRPHRPEGDKVMRALPWFARAEQGLVYLVAGEWVQPFLDQLSSFPGGRHDDRIDSVSGCFAKLAPAVTWKHIEFLHV